MVAVNSVWILPTSPLFVSKSGAINQGRRQRQLKLGGGSKSGRPFWFSSLRNGSSFLLSCLPPPTSSSSSSFSSSLSPQTASAAVPSTKLYVSGLSFRTTEEGLRNAFEKFGQLVEVNLVMDKVAKRPRGFAFLRYSTVEESQKAIEGMHGKFLDGRVIFVEVAKSRSELRQVFKRDPGQS